MSTFKLRSWKLQLLGKPSQIDVAALQSPYAEPTLRQMTVRAPRTFADAYPKVCVITHCVLSQLTSFRHQRTPLICCANYWCSTRPSGC